MSRLAALLAVIVIGACGGSAGAGGADAPSGDALTPDQLACTPRAESDVPAHFKGPDYVPALSVEGSVTQGGRTWQIQSAAVDMHHLRDPDLADRCVIDYRVLAFLERDAPTCVLALHFINSGNDRNLYELAFDTRGCPGVASADEMFWESSTPVAPLWPVLAGSLLDVDQFDDCADATVAFPDVVLPIPAPYATTVSLAGLRVAGRFGSRADIDFNGTCDVPVAAECPSGTASPSGVCDPY